ncbi:uncharacterized protein LOC116146046 [Pistacia vera]|uniref:uncharacterized protein LOC116146046 n=1 Tax=Pistacia vera TaxID=55513 RepID=UPI001262AD91|nr:uncharacterized protein LOC116146046 [Pistacia vera]
MGGYSSDPESWISSKNSLPNHHESRSLNFTPPLNGLDQEYAHLSKLSSSKSLPPSKKKKNQVLLEGYVETESEDDLKRTKSLTDEDLDELKGCCDLGFGFSYEEIPELCNTLPALELCYSMSQKFLDEHQKSPERTPVAESVASPIANWKISSPGDHPEDVKARLKYWAQAVACTVRLCS